MDVFIDSRFDDLYRRHPLVLVDVGARGGLKKNWMPARRHLRVFGFEPDRREFSRLVARRAAQEGATRTSTSRSTTGAARLTSTSRAMPG